VVRRSSSGGLRRQRKKAVSRPPHSKDVECGGLDTAFFLCGVPEKVEKGREVGSLCFVVHQQRLPTGSVSTHGNLSSRAAARDLGSAESLVKPVVSRKWRFLASLGMTRFRRLETEPSRPLRFHDPLDFTGFSLQRLYAASLELGYREIDPSKRIVSNPNRRLACSTSD